MGTHGEGVVKERPILFSAPMVQGILAGNKTKTRRVLELDWLRCLDPEDPDDLERIMSQCRYGVPGDRLWVREAHYAFGHWEPVAGAATRGGKQKWKFVRDTDEVLYEEPPEFRNGRHNIDPETPAWHKRLARFMFRKDSRTTLEIVSVRVERLREISEEDAIAEGVPVPVTCDTAHTARNGFRDLWETINGAGSWDANPFVWVVEFELIEVCQWRISGARNSAWSAGSRKIDLTHGQSQSTTPRTWG